MNNALKTLALAILAAAAAAATEVLIKEAAKRQLEGKDNRENAQ
jgi:hypothetical protein